SSHRDMGLQLCPEVSKNLIEACQHVLKCAMVCFHWLCYLSHLAEMSCGRNLGSINCWQSVK
ncbi:Hypothetical predicted protein, partial [Pelobates cultripes]